MHGPSTQGCCCAAALPVPAFPLAAFFGTISSKPWREQSLACAQCSPLQHTRAPAQVRHVPPVACPAPPRLQDLKARTKLAVSGQFDALNLNKAPKFGFGYNINY